MLFAIFKLLIYPHLSIWVELYMAQLFHVIAFANIGFYHLRFGVTIGFYHHLIWRFRLSTTPKRIEHCKKKYQTDSSHSQIHCFMKVGVASCLVSIGKLSL